ncbi:MAG: helix-turn-helix transcriptional regulator [Actinomycetota bacterium]
MSRDEQAQTRVSEEARWPIDLEVTVAKNIRWLREGRGITQQQLGSDLSLSGFGMHQMTVAQLEAGVKPLRLNEVAAIAAYFELPVEALWRQGGDGVLSITVDDGLGAAQAADVEQMAADYYTQQRVERLRDK